MAKDQFCGRYRVSLAAALLCVVPYQGFYAQSAARTSRVANPAIAMWEMRKPSIEKTLAQNLDDLAADHFDVQVLDAFGLAENDPAVALVDYGHGGAYTDAIAVMRMEAGAPVVARFRDRKGRVIANGFVFLSGASAMHTVDVKLVPEKTAIYDRFAENNSEGKLARCRVTAYVWNPKSRTFDEDPRLSGSASTEYCRSLRAAR